MRTARLLILTLLLATGCARAVEIGSGPSPNSYRIQVRNETSQSMVVSYNDGRGDAVLGTVAANATESFIIASPARTDITVRGEGSTRTSGPYSVTLSAGTQTVVRLR